MTPLDLNLIGLTPLAFVYSLPDWCSGVLIMACDIRDRSLQATPVYPVSTHDGSHWIGSLGLPERLFCLLCGVLMFNHERRDGANAVDSRPCPAVVNAN